MIVVKTSVIHLKYAKTKSHKKDPDLVKYTVNFLLVQQSEPMTQKNHDKQTENMLICIFCITTRVLNRK